MTWGLASSAGEGAASVPKVTWSEIERASRTRPASLVSLRRYAVGVMASATIEALTGAAIARWTGAMSKIFAGPLHLNITTGFRWVAYHFAEAASAVSTVGHSGGEGWVPWTAFVAASLLVLTAAASHGWREGRSVVAAATAVGIAVGAVASLPLVLFTVLALLAVVGCVLWAVLVAVVCAVAVYLAVVLGFLLVFGLLNNL
jgi:hypothetical protein